MLLAGELDALVHEQAHQFLLRHPGLRRLLPDHRVDETAYYHATGCFPLNHVLVARRELLEAEPGIVAALQAAFEASRQHALAIMDRSNVQVSVAWMDSLLEEERRRLGPDLFVDGLERTRPSIERLIRYLVEQQLIPEPLAVEEVFAG